MRIYDNKALLLKVRNPQMITTVIPKSKLLPSGEVAVKWGLQESHVLKNIGIRNVPSPITASYGWPGMHKPFDHQHVTAEFLTMHKRAFCFNEAGCVDSETEYLSPTGWVKISEYAGGKVAQYHPATNTADFVDPTEYVKLPCAEMIRIKTKYGLDQLLSPEHRVLLVDGKKAKPKTETVSAQTLLDRHDARHDGFKHSKGGCKAGTSTIAFSSGCVPTSFLVQNETSMPYSDEQLRVLVAAIADGYFAKHTKWCSVRLKKQRKKDRLRRLLEEAGIDFVDKPCQPDGFHIIKFYAPERWKEFGEEVWAASVAQRKVIADECMHWDGCVTRGKRFFSTSKASADFVQYAFTSVDSKNGATARISIDPIRGVAKKPTYQVRVRDGLNKIGMCSDRKTMWREPSTDGFKYCFMVPSTYLLFRRNGCVFASGNTGKTSAAIWAADYLMSIGEISRVLVVCPLSIMDAAWRGDMFKTAMHRKVDIAHGSAKKRKSVIESDAEFVITNFDTVVNSNDLLRYGGFDLVIADEASNLKNSQTARWKAFKKLIGPDTWLWMMTGTPAAQSPVDAFGLAKLVNPQGCPAFFTAFRDMVMNKVSPFRYLPKPEAKTIVHNVLQPAIRFEKKDCLDLPPVIHVTRKVELTPQQKKYYDILKNKMVMEADGEQVTAANAAVKLSKLLQVSAGCAYSDGGETIEFDISNRYNVLMEIINETNEKILIFVPFTNSIDVLAEKLAADGITNAVINGAVPASKRGDIIRAFQNQDDPRVLIIQPQAAAHGITLTAADTVVWWGPTASVEIFEQANARVDRPGQKNKCTVYRLYGSFAEWHVYNLLDTKRKTHNSIIDLYKKLLD